MLVFKQKLFCKSDLIPQFVTCFSSTVYGEKLNMKQEIDSELLVKLSIPEEKELEMKCQDKENTQKNESKRRKVSIKKASGHKEKENI